MLRIALVAFCLVLCFAASVPAEDPLHVRIDALVAARTIEAPLAAADDAEFLRRAWLDLAGTIPGADEARGFLADEAPDKRQKLVERLLAGPEYPRRMQDAFHVMLMERRGDHDAWTAYLHDSFAANKPWNTLVAEMLSPDAASESTRGSAFFLTKRLENYGQNPVDLPALTRDVGRLLLGVDLQCAQCHDHLQVSEYRQVDFQGLFSFLGHTYIRKDVDFPAVGENLVQQKTPFMSVFVQKEEATGPRLPGGPEIEIPMFEKGEEYAIPPDPKTRLPGVPKFSPLGILSEQLPRPDNPAFVRNSVNRFWFLMMGRGLVHPLDLHHADNPPSHPDLLDLLAAEFVAHDFDVRWLLRELALTATYQRTSRLPEQAGHLPAETYVVANEKPLAAEQLLAAMLQATGPHEGLKQDDLRARFLKAFANPPQEPEVEFAPSVKGALFVLNDGEVLNLLKPAGGNLVARLSQLGTSAEIADELYLSVLTRLPTDDERAELDEFLTQHGSDRPRALGLLAWGLLASTEFCLNH